MTPLQTLELRSSEIRKRLATIGGLKPDDLTDEIRSELEALRNEYTDKESQKQALIVAGDESAQPIETRSNEDREFQAMVAKSNVGEIFDAALNHRAIDGATAELQEHYGLDKNQVPLTLLMRFHPEDKDLETRAVSPSPTNVGQDQHSIIAYVFPKSVAAFLGVAMPTVPTGDSVYPVLTSKLDVGTPAKNASQGETTGAFSAEVLTPARLQASFFYSREDRARFAGMDVALRENLNVGLSDGLDKEIIAGSNGLLHATNLANHAATAISDYASYRTSMVHGRVDGRYASTGRDIKVVVGAETYEHMASVYRSSSDNMDALGAVERDSDGIRVSSHVPAASGSKQNSIVRLGMNRDMVAPIWEGVSIIPDEVTQAKKGQVIITAVMLHAIKIIRTDGFYKTESQHA